MKAYSYDLRVRAMSLLDSGYKRKELCKILSISLSSLDRWIKLKKETGSFKARDYNRTGNRAKITNNPEEVERFKKFIIDNNHLSLSDLANKWGDISSESIRRTLKKLGYSFKKNPFYMQKETKSLENH